jgi:hypothetical protein
VEKTIERMITEWADGYRRAAEADGFKFLLKSAVAEGWDCSRPDTDGPELVEGAIAVAQIVVKQRNMDARRAAHFLEQQGYGLEDGDREVSWAIVPFGASEVPVFVDGLEEMDFEGLRRLGCFRLYLERLAGPLTTSEAWGAAQLVYRSVNTDGATTCHWQHRKDIVVVYFEDVSDDRERGALNRRDELFFLG